MSLTIAALVFTVVAGVIGVALMFAAEEYGIIAAMVGALFLAAAVGAIIVAIGSYNSNVRDNKEQDKIACVEQGFQVIRYNATDYCVSPGSTIIRTIR